MKRFRLSTLLLWVIIAAMGAAWLVEHRKMKRYEVVYLREQQKEIQAARKVALMEPVFRAFFENFAVEQRRKSAKGDDAGKASVSTNANKGT